MVENVFNIEKNLVVTGDLVVNHLQQCGFPNPAHTGDHNNFSGGKAVVQFALRFICGIEYD